ncbi:MAG: plastocyanin domain-containing protein [Planctomycetota bacterium]|jgi:plastocyanin domain-containing protein
MNKTASIIITVALVIAMGIVFVGGSKTTDTYQEMQNTDIIDGIQYITINAKAGYSPRTTTAQAGIPTKLIMKTKNTYDCSAALVIKSIDYQKILPSSGAEVIDIGTPIAGEPLQGLCSMGMYNFEIDFKKKTP